MIRKRTLEAAARQAIAQAPGSMRALAREAGLPAVRLVRIRQGKSIKLTREDAKAICHALERWGGQCARSVTQLRMALRSPGTTR